MFTAKRLFGYLATGVMPEMTALDESLAEHDKKYHPDGYKEGDSCNKRETMAGGDGVDKVEKRGGGGQRNGSSSKRGNGVTAEEDAAYMDAVKRGDMETARRMVCEAAAKAMPDTKVVDGDGLPKVVWHETDAEFSAFDPFHAGCGGKDYQTPFGIFMKPTDRTITVTKGTPKQMSLFASLKNPLLVRDRNEIDRILRLNCNEYSRLADEIKRLDEEYGKKFKEAEEEEDLFFKDLYKNHREVWDDDEKRKELEEQYSKKAEDVLEKWRSEQDVVSEKLKGITDKYFRTSQYDGIVMENDEGLFGRRTKTYIALEPTQVKSADPVTYDDADQPILLSRRFDFSSDDIRY